MNYTPELLNEIYTYHINGSFPDRIHTAEQKRYFTNRANKVEKNNGIYYEVVDNIRKKIVTDENEKRQLVLTAYLSPKSSVAHRGFDIVHKHIYALYANISQSYVRDVINSTESKQLHAPVKAHKVVAKTYTDKPNSQIAIDETEFLNGYFILLAVDVASKKLYGMLKKKNFTKPDVINLIKAINIETGNTPIIIADNGQIFNLTSDEVPNKIIHTKIYTSQANGRIESYNKKVKELMLRYIDNGELISQDLLKKVLFSLNNNYNNSIKAYPAIANMDGRIKTVPKMVDILGPKIAKGDYVRIQNTTENLSLRKSVTYKSSHVKHWSQEIYRVARVVVPRTPTLMHYYLIEGKGDVRYYDFDLLKIPNNTPIKTEDVLGKKETKEPEKKEVSKVKKAEINYLEWNNRYMKPAEEKRKRVQRKL